MNDLKIYGYVSLRTGRTKADFKEGFEQTKLYFDYKEIVKCMERYMFSISKDEKEPDYRLIENNMVFEPDKTMQVDVMTSRREGMHYKLNCIIEQSVRINNEEKKFFAEHGIKSVKKQVNTVIVLHSISALGNCEDIKKYYSIFKKEKIGVLIPDYTRESSLSEFSTCDFGFKFRPLAEYNRANDLVERLKQTDLPDTRGIVRSYPINFRAAFWLYELYKIPEKMASEMSGLSKNGFHKKADDYEQTFEYREELKTMEKEFNISSLVKRNRPIPENFDKLIYQCEKLNSLELACIRCNIPMIFPIDYKRLLLKAQGGRKELARCLKLYDKELITRYEKWIEAGNESTEFYRQCNMEQYLWQ